MVNRGRNTADTICSAEPQGADSHLSCKSASDEANRTTSSAKSKDSVPNRPNWKPSSPSVKFRNRITPPKSWLSRAEWEEHFVRFMQSSEFIRNHIKNPDNQKLFVCCSFDKSCVNSVFLPPYLRRVLTALCIYFFQCWKMTNSPRLEFYDLYALCFRWEQRWTLTCWSTMKTPWQLFCVFTAGQLQPHDGRKISNRLKKMRLIFFVCVSFRGLVKLWSSLTLLGFYQNQACAFRVLQVRFTSRKKK